MKKIPIKEAKRIAKELKYDQILVFGWDKNEDVTSVATYGKSEEDCSQIAQLGNWFKRNILKWSEKKCCDEPNRVKKLKKQSKIYQWAMKNCLIVTSNSFPSEHTYIVTEALTEFPIKFDGKVLGRGKTIEAALENAYEKRLSIYKGDLK